MLPMVTSQGWRLGVIVVLLMLATTSVLRASDIGELLQGQIDKGDDNLHVFLIAYSLQ